ncbi:recombinase family protein [Mobilicoccus caccae]|uniref:Transposase n=1 Tax=Mobilicoccus caccae TaxID=1859295 RepID=A0ABQ6IYZ4_9MICO|nr:recombinase family protein [Mobilicoccus caccae]GMA42392.1 transposase [Mobilicoccus caccae]GMA42468.1 transposase [Mobilicoccus caccae]
MTPKGQVVGYARVSTEDQNLDRQLAAIGEVDRLFTDRLSGAHGVERPGLNELLAYVRAGDRVRVSSLDRLARSLVDLEAWVETLTAKGVEIEFVTNRLVFAPGVDDPFAVFQRQMIGAFAQFERSILRERQREGIEQAKKRGVYKGRKRALDPDAVAAVRRRAATGEKLTQLAADYGCSRRVIHDVVHGGGAYPFTAARDRMAGEVELPILQ